MYVSGLKTVEAKWWGFQTFGNHPPMGEATAQMQYKNPLELRYLLPSILLLFQRQKSLPKVTRCHHLAPLSVSEWCKTLQQEALKVHWIANVPTFICHKKLYFMQHYILWFLWNVMQNHSSEMNWIILCISFTGKDNGCNVVTGLHQPNDPMNWERFLTLDWIFYLYIYISVLKL